MRFLYSRKEIVSFNVIARIFRFLKTYSICKKMLHSLVLDQTFFYKKANNLQ